jgi:hypothetical protein
MEDESCEAASDGRDLVATADAVHDHRHHHLQHQIAGELESHEEQQQLHHDSEFEEEPVLGKIESPHNKPVLGREPATEWSETATSVLIAAFRYKQSNNNNNNNNNGDVFVFVILPLCGFFFGSIVSKQTMRIISEDAFHMAGTTTTTTIIVGGG